MFITKHKKYFKVFFVLKPFECFWIFKIFRSESDFGRLFKWLFRRLWEDFLGSLLMNFMLEDVPRSLQEVIRNFLPKVVQILDMYFLCIYILDSKNYRFNLIWLFCLLFKHKKLFLKFSLFWSHLNAFEDANFFRSDSDFGRLLVRLSEDSWKTSCEVF